MLLTFLVILFGLQYRTNCINATTHTSTNQEIELGNLPEQDLRRNNDEYIDKLNNSNFLSVLNKQTADNVAKTNVKDQVRHIYLEKPRGMDANRRNINSAYKNSKNKLSITPVTNKPSIIAVPMIKPKRFKKVTQNTVYVPNSQIQKLTTDNYPKNVNKSREEKIYQFMEKNKDMVQNFISKMNRKGTQAEPMPTLAASLEDTAERVQRAQTSKERDLTPAPGLLDMAPAKGGRIHALRLKGRLCGRSVLMPEGPKYDSKGGVYLSAFQSTDTKDYPNTKPPSVLLPKCCNCCQKSVLGCE